MCIDLFILYEIKIILLFELNMSHEKYNKKRYIIDKL